MRATLKTLTDTIPITETAGVLLLLLRGEVCPLAVEEITEVNIPGARAPVEAVAAAEDTAVLPGLDHRAAEVLSTLGNTVDSTMAAPRVAAAAAVAATDTRRHHTIGTNTRLREDRHLLPGIIRHRLQPPGAGDNPIPEAAEAVITTHPIDTGIRTPAAVHLLQTTGEAHHHRTRPTNHSTHLEGDHLPATPTTIGIIRSSSNNN